MRDVRESFLPLGSENENIERISRQRFEALFDHRFILKDELIDNGIDYRNEILLEEGQKTGFGFNFQLKAKIKATKNADGSYSKSLETSNIEYLLNNGQPAFYGFYVKNEDTIYYENLQTFINQLDKKSPKWQFQENHTIRFTKVLDANAVNEIYRITYDHGVMWRKINYKMAVGASTGNAKHGVQLHIDSNHKVTDDKEIRELIEEAGLLLIDEGRWSEILDVHKVASGGVAISAKYNLILGLANYYSSNIITAITFFKDAIIKIQELPEELQKHLRFFDLVSRHVVGIISKADYYERIKEFEESDNIGFYVKLEQAKNEYESGILMNNPLNFDRYHKTVQSIIDDPNAGDNIKILAECDLLVTQGHRNNIDYIRNVSLINASEMLNGPLLEARAHYAQEFSIKYNLWSKANEMLARKAYHAGNILAYHNAIFNGIKINYELCAYSEHLTVEKPLPEPESESLRPFSNIDLLTKLLTDLEEVLNYYNRISYTENVIVALSLKYEIEHLLGDLTSAQATLLLLENYSKSLDSVDFKRKFEALKQKGTKHESFKAFIDTIIIRSGESREFEEIVRSMTEMDNTEKAIPTATDDYLYIELFPIDRFKFPKDRLNEVLTMLNIEKDAQEGFNTLFSSNIQPVANILNEVIICEGYGEGKSADKGILSWRNIYRIRKYFFDNKFTRFR